MDKLIRTIENKFNRLKESKKNTLFRELVMDSIDNFARQCKERMIDLDDRIHETFREEDGDYFISTLLLPKGELPIYEDDFQKVVRKERETNNYFSLEKEHNLIIDSFPVITDEDIENRVINGHYTKDEKSYPIKIQILKNTDYLERVKDLYDLFRKNKKKWKSIPMYYFDIIYDLKIIDAEFPGEKRAVNYDDISYDLGSLEGCVYRDYIPVWNLFRERRDVNIRVRPLKSRIIYEYDFGQAPEEKVLLDSAKGEVTFVYRNKKNSLKAHVNNKVTEGWDIYTTKTDIEETRYQKETFPILTNKAVFISSKQKRQANDVRMLRTEEMRRYLMKFESLKNLNLEGIEIVDEFGEKAVKANDNFINNEFNLKGRVKKLLISFSSTEEFIAEGRINLAVNIVSGFFPEYEVRGRLG